MKAGLRQGEFLGLRWRDVDLLTGRIIVRQSNRAGDCRHPKGRAIAGDSLSPDLLTSSRRKGIYGGSWCSAIWKGTC